MLSVCAQHTHTHITGPTKRIKSIIHLPIIPNHIAPFIIRLPQSPGEHGRCAVGGSAALDAADRFGAVPHIGPNGRHNVGVSDRILGGPERPGGRQLHCVDALVCAELRRAC